MAGIFSKLNKIVKGVLGDAVDTLDDPARDARQLIRDIESNIDALDESKVKADTNYNILKHKATKAHNEADEFKAGAQRAVAAGNDDLAKRAIAGMKEAQKMAEEFDRQLAALGASIEKINQQRDSLEAQLSKQRNQVTIYESRMSVAQSQSLVADTLSNVRGGLGADFEALEERVEREEARAEAKLDQITTTSKVSSLKDELNSLGETDTVDDILLQMKKDYSEK